MMHDWRTDAHARVLDAAPASPEADQGDRFSAGAVGDADTERTDSVLDEAEGVDRSVLGLYADLAPDLPHLLAADAVPTGQDPPAPLPTTGSEEERHG